MNEGVYPFYDSLAKAEGRMVDKYRRS